MYNFECRAVGSDVIAEVTSADERLMDAVKAVGLSKRPRLPLPQKRPRRRRLQERLRREG